MTPTERQRIVEEAEKYGFQVPYDGSSEFYDRSAVKAYIAGVTAWHDKVRNQAIQDCIDTLVDDIKIPVTSSWLEKLEQLKTKP